MTDIPGCIPFSQPFLSCPPKQKKLPFKFLTEPYGPTIKPLNLALQILPHATIVKRLKLWNTYCTHAPITQHDYGYNLATSSLRPSGTSLGTMWSG
jgi:hypothetical protein